MPSIKWIAILVIAIIIGIGVLVVSLDNMESQFSPEDKKSRVDANLEDESIKDIILDTDVSINSSIAYINSPYVKEYSLPNGMWPNGILVDRNGMVWTAGSRSHILLNFDPNDGQIKTVYPIKEESSDVMKGGSLMVWSIVEDNDGFIWFSQFGPDRLWRFDPKAEKFYVFHSLSAPPFQMKVDKDTGSIWFTTLTGNTLGVIQKIENKNESSPEYKITEFDMDSDSNPSGLFLEKYHVWVSQISNNKLVKFNVVTDSNGLVTDVVRISEISSSEGIPIY
ncbi:MAG: two-component regulator propeller domain-containing protein, partial [Nitrosopumilaceae archaeon]